MNDEEWKNLFRFQILLRKHYGISEKQLLMELGLPLSADYYLREPIRFPSYKKGTIGSALRQSLKKLQINPVINFHAITKLQPKIENWIKTQVDVINVCTSMKEECIFWELTLRKEVLLPDWINNGHIKVNYSK